MNSCFVKVSQHKNESCKNIIRNSGNTIFHAAYTMVLSVEERVMNTVMLPKLFLLMMERKKLIDPTSTEFLLGAWHCVKQFIFILSFSFEIVQRGRYNTHSFYPWKKKKKNQGSEH